MAPGAADVSGEPSMAPPSPPNAGGEPVRLPVMVAPTGRPATEGGTSVASEAGAPQQGGAGGGLAGLLGAEYENMLRCIRCGLCLSVCPTYQLTLLEEESPRGRIAMARAVTEGFLPLTPDFVQHEES